MPEKHECSTTREFISVRVRIPDLVTESRKRQLKEAVQVSSGIALSPSKSNKIDHKGKGAMIHEGAEEVGPMRWPANNAS